MSRLDIAAKRLEEVLAALEEASGPLMLARNEAADAKARLAALTQERDQLLARIAELEEENRALSGIAGEVEERLDGAIGEIRAALGR
jgi:chromosome segregation ATPase